MAIVGTAATRAESKRWPTTALLAAAILVAIYWKPFQEMYNSWGLVDSYYSHGMLIPPLCAFLAWRRRKEFFAAPEGASLAGYPVLAASCAMLILGGFLGFGAFQQFSLVPMLFGVSLLLFGAARTRAIWFPIFFLVMMIPIPASLTQSVSFKLKMFAANRAMDLVSLTGLPMVQQGSFILFKDDRLLIGDVCGGLRSLIALLAIGLLMAYFSRTKTWARVIILAMSGPIAVMANVVRILILCIVGYFYGSEFAAGKFHDISGVFIFASAFVLFFTLEGILRWLGRLEEPAAPAASKGDPSS